MKLFLMLFTVLPLLTYGVEHTESDTKGSEHHADHHGDHHGDHHADRDCDEHHGDCCKEGPKGSRGHRGKKGEKGEKGDTGPQGPVGPPGPTGGSGTRTAESSVVSAQTSVGAVPNFPFSFEINLLGNTCVIGGIPHRFNPLTTNDPNVIYETFFVPVDGTISDLTVRVDLTAVVDANPSFTFTVFRSTSLIGAIRSITGWTPTALTISTGPINIAAGDSVEGSFQDPVDEVHVTRGTLLTIVITGDNVGDFVIRPANFAAAFKFTPDLP